ncbi:MAG: S8 family serine peptidase [Ruminococcus sp.]|nr:S8 family serine peptidase [Ruminococcus sp.]
MKLKKLLSIIMVAAISLTALCYPLLTSAKVDYSYKIDPALAEKLEKMDENDFVYVSIWLKDLDKQTVKKEIQSEVNDYCQKRGDNTLKLFLNEDIETKKDFNMSIEHVNDYTKIERGIKSKLYSSYNNTAFNSIFSSSAKISNNHKEYGLLYISKLAPNIDILISKSKIYEIIDNKYITNIYVKDKVIDSYRENMECTQTREVTTRENTYDMWYFEETGIKKLRDTYSADGTGVKIAVIEGYVPDRNLSCFTNTDLTIRTGDEDEFVAGQNGNDDHINYVLSVMAAQTSDYTGAIPNAEFYSASVNIPYPDTNPVTDEDNDGWKYAFEWAILQNVNVITSSVFLGHDSVNNYGEASKWYEHIMNEHSVTFVMTSPNSGGFPSGTMSYNTIIVGNSNKSSLLQTPYLQGINDPYKPDLMAPGTNISTPLGTSSGASLSTPIVASAAVQLIQKYPFLAAYPVLIKTLLLNGATYTGTENIVNNSSDFVALRRDGGAGVLNVLRSRIEYLSMHWVTGLHTHTNTNPVLDTNNLFVSVEKKPVHVTICSFVPSTESNYNSNIGYATFRITVTKGANTWTSVCHTDNKCAVRFTPTQNGWYSVIIERIDTNNINTKVAAVYSSE